MKEHHYCSYCGKGFNYYESWIFEKDSMIHFRCRGYQREEEAEIKANNAVTDEEFLHQMMIDIYQEREDTGL